jgi:hypothetical protein
MEELRIIINKEAHQMREVTEMSRAVSRTD